MTFSNPNAFLNKLGVQNRPPLESEASPIPADLSSAKWRETVFDPMDARLMDGIFVDEAKAIETLESNFERLGNSMRRVSTSSIFDGGPVEKVAELGCGSGLVSLWLAECGLCHRCRVYDHAAKPLAIGEQWANRLGLGNVSFHHLSYAEIASNPPTNDCDFVFAEHAVQLSGYPVVWDDEDEVGRQYHDYFARRYVELCAAISALLKPGAVALIGAGAPEPWALDLLCDALRAHHLVIDWPMTTNSDGLQLYVRTSGTVLLNSTHDEALALNCDSVEERELPDGEIASQRELFADGTVYLHLRFRTEDEKGEVIVQQKAGYAFLLKRGASGYQAAALVSAGRIADVARDGLGVVASMKNCVVTHRYIDSRLEDIVSDGGPATSATG